MYDLIYKSPKEKYWYKLPDYNQADHMTLGGVKKLRKTYMSMFPSFIFRIQNVNKPLPGKCK